MAHARYTSPHTDTPYPFPKRSPVMAAWNANEDPLYVHPDRLDGYMCYAGAVVSDTFSNGVAPRVSYGPGTGGVLIENVQVQAVAGVKRRWREASHEECLSPLYEEQTENAKRMCMRECQSPDLGMDCAPTHLHGDNLTHPVADLPTPMDTVTMATTSNPCNNFCHKKLQLYTLAEAGVGCHHSQVGLSSIDCHRCLAGQPGHLDHILHPQEGMDTHN